MVLAFPMCYRSAVAAVHRPVVRGRIMEKTNDFKGGVPEPSPDDLLTIPEIAKLYGIGRSAVRQWKLEPHTIIPMGNRHLRLYRRADVEAYANSERRLNRLPKPTNPQD
jgi:hypothetical protein